MLFPDSQYDCAVHVLMTWLNQHYGWRIKSYLRSISTTHRNYNRISMSILLTLDSPAARKTWLKWKENVTLPALADAYSKDKDSIWIYRAIPCWGSYSCWLPHW